MKPRLFLGVFAMIAVQIIFGIASELSSSTALIFAIPIVGSFSAAACGGFVARRSFVLPGVLVLLVDLALIAYALPHTTEEPVDYSVVPPSGWAMMVLISASFLAAGAAGAKVGTRFAARYALANASPTA
ncbi:hypothetical protein [Rhodanobacter sp. C03]|uniref:hypothetical protein n=1 Tax=Rhodanobacter sp. C03 TaxID=1945858 RepID=UPI0011157CC5|nr:hypothetical protein [Rhodanobacter sp. C03]